MIWLALLLSMLVHELGHASMAESCGDPTPRMYGRLTLNPLRHLSWLWSGVLPLAVFAASHGALVAGAMKPMPVGYARLTPRQRIQIALAGPGLNLFLAGVLWLLWPEAAVLNLVLCGVNLLPIPPLDGWRLVEALRA